MEQTWNKWVFYLKKMKESSPLRQGIEQASAIISHRDISGTLLNSILKYETRLEGRLLSVTFVCILKPEEGFVCNRFMIRLRTVVEINARVWCLAGMSVLLFVAVDSPVGTS